VSPAEDIRDVRGRLRDAREDLLRRRNVVATGVGYKVAGDTPTDHLSIVCSVTRKMPEAQLASRDLVPREIAGVPTDVVETGEFRALGPPADTPAAQSDPLDTRRRRHRPAPGGVSVGHRDITAGTIGCIVRRGGERYILSNNHVLADSNRARIGDPVLQPGPYDGGRIEDDRIADLAAFVQMRMMEETSTCFAANGVATLLNMAAILVGSQARVRTMTARATDNLVDAAIAGPVPPDLAIEEILEIGVPSGIAFADLGMKVRKSGRTTGLTHDEVLQVDVTANVRYGDTGARFTDQVMTGPMSQGGDSGSVVLDEQGRVVGLLFGGSDKRTLVNRIEHVFAALDVTL